jgi:tRNA pseudouridine55 synthase
MIILAGKATKKSDEFLKKDKEYEATVYLGKTSTTGDIEGEITDVSDKVPTLDEVKAACEKFVGEINQTVPIFSAVKINGERAYKLARKGKEVEMPTRKVTIFSIDILDYTYPELKIRTHVSSGTYIRTLGEDIGKALGTGAYLTALRRTKIADYDIKDALKLDEFMEGDVL